MLCVVGSRGCYNGCLLMWLCVDIVVRLLILELCRVCSRKVLV